MKSLFLAIIGTFLLVFLPPILVFAVVFPPPLGTVRSVGLRLSVLVAGQEVKSPILVPANTDFTLAWKSEGTACLSNWTAVDVTLPASGSSVGSLTIGTLNRPFVITCYGRGAAQTATVQVTVGVTDISVASFSIVGLKNGKERGAYIEGSYTLKASLRNLGKLPTATPFKIKYNIATNAEMTTGLRNIGEIWIGGIGGGSSKQMDPFGWQSTPSADSLYFQMCADTASAIAESVEDNNCSRVLGPYKFVTKL